VHIFPYWDFSPGQIIDVRICTNAPKAELFFNGKSMGTFEVNHKTDKKLIGDFRIPYEPGELICVAYTEDGKEAARTVRRSFGDAVGFDVKQETVDELTFYEITALDKDGNAVENANNRVNVSITNGKLLGMDNGDSTDFDQYKTNSRRLFNGKLLAIAKAESAMADCAEKMEIHVDECKEDIPVRKVELTLEGFTVTAKTYPENATYNDLVWRLADVSGITSPLGIIDASEDGHSAVITPTGDGELYIRCGVKNGADNISLYTQISMTLEGYGKPLLDPYTFVTGGLCNLSNGELGNGNERGVVTLRDGESHVGFENVDFGAFGSDEVTLSLFPLSQEPFVFEVWTGGLPGHGGSMLCSLLYDKGSIWNTYIEAAYKLPRRLRGIETICFVFNGKIHIGGFVFNRQNKAYEKLNITDNDFIYGDTYTVKPQSIENIGNNVTIGFNDMDFGSSGAEKIEINQRCKQKNSFQIIATDKNNIDIKTMIEVKPTKDYTSMTFDLIEKLRGKTKVSLVFLPGCDIDIEWIQFK
jgi:beta-galactosidase